MRYNLRDALVNFGRVQRSDSVTSATGPLGSSAAYFDGNNVNPVVGGNVAGISAADAGSIVFPADLSWEMLVQFSAITGDRWVINHNSAGWVLYRKASTGKLVFSLGGTDRISSTTTIAANTNYAVSLVRSSGVITLRINGVAEGGTYSNAVAVSGGSSILFGADGSATSRFNGYLDELVMYSTAIRAADYTPTFAEVVEGSSNPDWASVVLLVHGGYSSHSSASVTPAAKGFQTFAPTWPGSTCAAAAAVTVGRVYWGGLGRVLGTVKIKGTPNLPVRRRVRLVREVDGVCVAEQWSDATTGAYAFLGYDPALAYTVLTYDGPRVFRASVQDGVVPETYAP